jgi:hypothetical protein
MSRARPISTSMRMRSACSSCGTGYGAPASFDLRMFMGGVIVGDHMNEPGGAILRRSDSVHHRKELHLDTMRSSPSWRRATTMSGRPGAKTSCANIDTAKSERPPADWRAIHHLVLVTSYPAAARPTEDETKRRALALGPILKPVDDPCRQFYSDQLVGCHPFARCQMLLRLLRGCSEAVAPYPFVSTGSAMLLAIVESDRERPPAARVHERAQHGREVLSPRYFPTSSYSSPCLLLAISIAPR